MRAQLSVCEFCVGNQERRIAFAPLCLYDSGAAPSQGKRSVDDFPDGVAAASAKIEGPAFPVSDQVVERLEMSVGEIRNVNIIPHRRSIGCGVVNAKNRNRARLIERG